jgi:hypothetical protein
MIQLTQEEYIKALQDSYQSGKEWGKQLGKVDGYLEAVKTLGDNKVAMVGEEIRRNKNGNKDNK